MDVTLRSVTYRCDDDAIAAVRARFGAYGERVLGLEILLKLYVQVDPDPVGVRVVGVELTRGGVHSMGDLIQLPQRRRKEHPMETLFDVKVVTDGNGLVRVYLFDAACQAVAKVERRFTVEDAEEQPAWIAQTLSTATLGAVAAGLL